MFKEGNAQKLVEYIQTLPKDERLYIAEKISEPKEKKKLSKKEAAKQRVLGEIKQGLLEMQEAKRTGKKLPTLKETLNELKKQR
jgi:hypothetical protein